MIEFSVVIAVYNKQGYLAKSLDSVLSQTYPNFELIIVNDGSTDASHDIIQNYLLDDRITYIQQENQGAGAARNKGIKKAAKPYIALLDADDIWRPNHLEVIVQAIKDFPEEAVFATSSVVFKGNKLFKRTYSVSKTQPIQKVNFFKASLRDSIINSSTLVVKATVFNQVGSFNTKYIRTEDTDLWIRIAAKFPVMFIWQETVQINRTKKSLSTQLVPHDHMMDFNSYVRIEKESPGAKKFLDLNRYALGIEAKLAGRTKDFKQVVASINSNNLTSRQRFLLSLPSPLLKILYKLNGVFANIGLQLSAYK